MTFPNVALRAGLAVFIAATLLGCAAPITSDKPLAEVPAQWLNTAGGLAPDELMSTWWAGFGTPQLSRLVEAALTDSPDVRQVAERVRQAEIQRGIANAARLPSASLGGSTGARMADGGEESTRSHSRSTSASLSVNYEVDLWGRVAANFAGSDASLQSSRFDLATARLTLSANVANTYFQTLALAARLEVARRNLAVAERVLRVVEARQRNGVATSLDVTRQRTTVLSQRTALLPLQLQEQQQRGALAVLLGRLPQTFTLEPERLDAMRIPAVSPGLPSDLLMRRPDVARAESDLRGADANIAAARAALLPSFSLSASGGLGTAELLSLANPSTSAGLTMSLAYALFDGGRQRGAISVAESQRRALIEGYRRATLMAFKEVDDALGNANRYLREELTQREIVAQSRESLRVAELRYREGSDDLLTVLDAQRTLFQAEDQLSQLRLSRLTSAIDLYRVLGGGWMQASEVAPPSDSDLASR